MIKCLTHLDSIGPPPTLYFGTEKTIKTLIGAIFSIIVYLTVILYLLDCLIELISKKNPLLQISNEYIKNPLINLDETIFMIGITNQDGIPINDINSKLIIKFKRSIRKGKSLTSYDYNAIPCKLKDLSKSLNVSEFNDSNDNYLCPPENFNFNFIGNLGSINYETVELIIKICDKTENPDCVSKDKIFKELEYINVKFVFSNIYIDPINYEKPISQYIITDNLLCPLASHRIDQYLFKNIELISDNGFILKDQKTYNNVQFDNKSSLILPIKDDKTILKIQLSSSLLKENYKREYVKISIVLSKTFAIYEIVRRFFSILHGFWIKNLFYSYLISLFTEKSDFKKKCKNSIILNSVLNNKSKIQVIETKPKIENYKYSLYELTLQKLCCYNKFKTRYFSLLQMKSLFYKSLNVSNIVKNNIRLKITDKILFGERYGFKRNISYYKILEYLHKNNSKNSIGIGYSELNKDSFRESNEFNYIDEALIKEYNRIQVNI